MPNLQISDNSSPKISVIIPTWNRVILLERAIRSALNQTLPPHEVLVCDDGSTDNSEKMVRSITDSRICWIHGEHAGRPAIPRNRGIQSSSGEWLAFLDSDDEWLPDKLETQMSAIKSSDCKAACSNAYRLFSNGEFDKHNLIDYSKNKLSFHDLLYTNKVICSSAIIHKSLHGLASGFTESITLKALEDYAFWLKISMFTDFIFINKPLLIYSDDSMNSIRKTDVNFFNQRMHILSDVINWSTSNKDISISNIKSLSNNYNLAKFANSSKVNYFIARIINKLRLI